MAVGQLALIGTPSQSGKTMLIRRLRGLFAFIAGGALVGTAAGTALGLIFLLAPGPKTITISPQFPGAILIVPAVWFALVGALSGQTWGGTCGGSGDPGAANLMKLTKGLLNALAARAFWYDPVAAFCEAARHVKPQVSGASSPASVRASRRCSLHWKDRRVAEFLLHV